MAEIERGLISIIEKRIGTAGDLLGYVGQEQVHTLGLKSSALDAAQMMRKYNIGLIGIRNIQYLPEGVVSERDLVQKVLANDRNPAEVDISQIMTPFSEVVSVLPSDSIRLVIIKFAENRFRFRHIMVTENNVFVGVVSIKDVLTYLHALMTGRFRVRP